MTETSIRRPQQDRSRATRQKVLEAAIDSLAELGWSGSSVSVVAKRAGVSRGATQHYFPTREALFAAAVEYVTEIRMAEIRQRASALPSGKGRTESIIEMLASLYIGPLFKAAVQLWVAASTEPTLRRHVVMLESHIGRQAHRAAVELLGFDESIPGARETVQGLLDMARGLGLADLMTDDAPRRREIVKHWSRIVDKQLAEFHTPGGP